MLISGRFLGTSKSHLTISAVVGQAARVTKPWWCNAISTI